MQFGNWLVTDTEIRWTGDSINKFPVLFSELPEIDTSEYDGSPLYKYIEVATDEVWLTIDDLFDFNYAFVYAFAKSGHEFDYAIFDNTLAYQFDLLDKDDDEQPDGESADAAETEQQRKDASTERD